MFDEMPQLNSTVSMCCSTDSLLLYHLKFERDSLRKRVAFFTLLGVAEG